MSGLTQTQHRRLKTLEAQVAKGAADIYESLRAIHDEKLYRAEHKTFEEYCNSRWGMSRQHAYNLLKHGQILRAIEDSDDSKMSTIVDKIKESHTREVADLPPEKAAEIITETAKANDGKVTAKAVKAKRYNDSFGPFDDQPVGEEPPEPEQPSLDDAIRSHNKVIRGLSDDLGRVYKAAETYSETNGWFDANRLQELNGRVQSAKNTLNAVKAVDACPYCDGNGCKRCRQTGYVNKTTMDAAPEK